MAVVQRGGLVGPTPGDYSLQAQQQLEEAFKTGVNYALQQQILAEQKRQAMFQEQMNLLTKLAAETPTGTISQVFSDNPSLAFKFLHTMGFDDATSTDIYNKVKNEPLTADAFKKLLAATRLKQAIYQEMGVSPEEANKTTQELIGYKQERQTQPAPKGQTTQEKNKTPQRKVVQQTITKTGQIISPTIPYTDVEMNTPTQQPQRAIQNSDFITPQPQPQANLNVNQNNAVRDKIDVNALKTEINNLTPQLTDKAEFFYNYIQNQYNNGNLSQKTAQTLLNELTAKFPSKFATVQLGGSYPSGLAPSGSASSFGSSGLASSPSGTYGPEAANASDILGPPSQSQAPPNEVPKNVEYPLNENRPMETYQYKDVVKKVITENHPNAISNPKEAKKVTEDDFHWKRVPEPTAHGVVQGLDALEKDLNNLDEMVDTGNVDFKRTVRKAKYQAKKLILQDVRYKDVSKLLTDPKAIQQISSFVDQATKDPGWLRANLINDPKGSLVLLESAQEMTPQQRKLMELQLKGKLATAMAKIYRAQADMKIADINLKKALKGDPTALMNYRLKLMDMGLQHDKFLQSMLALATKAMQSKKKEVQDIGVNLLKSLQADYKKAFGVILDIQKVNNKLFGLLPWFGSHYEVTTKGNLPSNQRPQQAQPNQQQQTTNPAFEALLKQLQGE